MSGGRVETEGTQAEAFACIRDAFVQAGRLSGHRGGSDRQLSMMYSQDGRLQLVLSEQSVDDGAKCCSSTAAEVASTLVHAHSLCKVASVVADVEAGTATIVRACASWRTTQILRRQLEIEQPPCSIILEFETSAADILQRELQCFCRRLLFPAFTTTLSTLNAGVIREGGRSELTEKERMREAMVRQCESHALLSTTMDACNCDVFMGVGCLDDNPQAPNLPNLESLPVEGYVYLDSVPVNMKPCHGLADLQRVCTQAIDEDASAKTKAVAVQNEGPGGRQDVGGPMIVLVHIVSRTTVDDEHKLAEPDFKCPLCAQDFLLWSEVSRNANTKLHFRYSHALDWNPKTGELRALIMPPDKTIEGHGKEAAVGDGSSSAGTSLYQSLKPAKGEKLQATNLRLNVKVGANVLGWCRTAVATGKKQRFPDDLPELYKDALGRLKKNHAWRQLRDWVIPSVAKSLSLCVDLFGSNAQEKQRQLLASLNATSSSDVLALVSRNLERSVEINDKDLPAKRSRADDTSVCEAEALEEDSSAVFVSDPGLIGFLKCKDHSSHSKLSDFVERSICVARGGLPSIQIFSNAQADDADLDAELASYSAFSKHREGASDAEWGSVPRKQELNCPAGRRRTRLSLSAYDLELSLEYARLLKVVQLVLTLLRTRKISTMRDVYYMDCRLFQSQTKSDRSIELLARCLNTPRYGLSIVSFSRGILCGAILLKEKDGQWMDCSSSPVTMPSCMHTIEMNADSISAVFVLEKECIFRRLINDNFVERQYNGKALLVTACGFPDVQTRMLLNRLSSKYPTLPIYGIADFDPYGVEIMATYTMGSKSRAHERDVLACPSLRWLGIHSSDIEAYQVPPSLKIPMTERDNSRVRKMLEREIFASPARAFWRHQLQEFLDKGCKYEIEALNAVHHVGSDPLGFLSGTFIHDKICRKDYWQDDLGPMQDD